MCGNDGGMGGLTELEACDTLRMGSPPTNVRGGSRPASVLPALLQAAFMYDTTNI